MQHHSVNSYVPFSWGCVRVDSELGNRHFHTPQFVLNNLLICLMPIFRGNSKYHYYGIRVKPGSPISNSTMHYDSSGGSDSTGNVPNNKVTGNRYSNRAGTSTPHNRNDSSQAHNSNPHMHQHHQVTFETVA